MPTRKFFMDHLRRKSDPAERHDRDHRDRDGDHRPRRSEDRGKTSMSAFVAQNIGAGKTVRAEKALFCGIATSILAGCCLGYFSFFHGDLMASLFARDPDVILAAATYLKAYAIDCILTSFLFCFVGFFNGNSRTLFVMLQGIIGSFGVRIPVAFFMSRQAGVTLFQIGLATPASSLVQIILCIGYFLMFHRKLRKEMPKSPESRSL